MNSLLKSLRLPTWLALAAAALVMAGCSSAPTPTAYNIEVKTDASLAGTSLQVDLVGANELADLPKWQSYSVTSYWQPGNAFRRDALKSTMEFGRGRAETQTLSGTDPKWAEWLRTGALYLVIVADLPGAVNDQSGNADPRRLIIPLDKAEWGGKVGTIQVLVQESGLRLMTPRVKK